MGVYFLIIFGGVWSLSWDEWGISELIALLSKGAMMLFSLSLGIGFPLISEAELVLMKLSLLKGSLSSLLRSRFLFLA